MESEKRKDVSEEEVEEFFAILRRIRVAVKYFDESSKSVEKAAKRWKPSSESEDFEVEANGVDVNVGKKKKEEGGVEENKGCLDLNVDAQ